MTSTVTRSEKWVHKSAIDGIQSIKLARERKQVKIIKSAVAHIETLRNRPIYRWFAGYPTLPKDTSNETDVLNWIQEVDSWFCSSKYYWKKDQDVLESIIDSTDPNMDDNHLMNLSIEDSAILEKWLKYK